MVKIGHWDLILTTLLTASGRFQAKGEIRPNEIRKPMYEQTKLKNVAMYSYKHIFMWLCDIKLFSANNY